MFAEVKAMMTNVSGDAYDEEIILNIKACVIDLTSSAEITLPGEVSITRTKNEQTGEWTITDNSTITDEFVIRVIAIWCGMQIGNPPNYDQLRASYKAYKGQMKFSRKYKPSEEVVTTEV